MSRSSFLTGCKFSAQPGVVVTLRNGIPRSTRCRTSTSTRAAPERKHCNAVAASSVANRQGKFFSYVVGTRMYTRVSALLRCDAEVATRETRVCEATVKSFLERERTYFSLWGRRSDMLAGRVSTFPCSFCSHATSARMPCLVSSLAFLSSGKLKGHMFR